MSARSAPLHEDGIARCPWCGVEPMYVRYHDEEWGVPEFDDRALFEKLLLDGFQAGLSWITILRKRDAFRRAFDGFEPERIARYDARKVARLMNDAAIVRNRAKIEASRTNARAWLAIQETVGFSRYLWGFVDGHPRQNRFRSGRQIPAETPLAQAISKDLRARGFSFVGPTIVYAFMQAVGMVNDHLLTCHRHQACADLSPR
ncbi:MAG: DNA-3-methyladenine glycosylase I [Pseudomonadota bacterium]|nr:DNA-3-methyladenine glycosylase I [Pseudomonadota bacterium]